jgi:hypothetical protein
MGKFRQPVITIPVRTFSFTIQGNDYVAVRPLNDAHSLYDKLGRVQSVSRGPLMVAQWLRYCATNRKVAGSIPNGVIGIFFDIILPIAL